MHSSLVSQSTKVRVGFSMKFHGSVLLPPVLGWFPFFSDLFTTFCHFSDSLSVSGSGLVSPFLVCPFWILSLRQESNVNSSFGPEPEALPPAKCHISHSYVVSNFRFILSAFPVRDGHTGDAVRSRNSTGLKRRGLQPRVVSCDCPCSCNEKMSY